MCGLEKKLDIPGLCLGINSLLIHILPVKLSLLWHRQASFDVNLQHPFNDVLASACKGEIGLSVTPKAATAIMFDSVDGAGQPERATWHAGSVDRLHTNFTNKLIISIVCSNTRDRCVVV